MFPIKYERCGHIHNSINDCIGICRHEGGNIFWWCDKCMYGQDFPNTYDVAILKFMKDNGTTWRKYCKQEDEKLDILFQKRIVNMDDYCAGIIFVGIFVCLMVSAIFMGIGESNQIRFATERALELDYAQYNLKTGKLEFTNDEIKWIIIGEK